MNVAVIGAGAVGLGIGVGLVAQGTHVRFVVQREAQRQALAEHGAARTGLFGDLHVDPQSFDVTCDVDSLAREPANAWLVCTKSTQGPELAERLGPLWKQPRPHVVLCQNGWGNAEIFARHLPPEHVFNARVITGFERTGETRVRVTVHADAIHIGHLGGLDASALDPLCEAIAKGGVPCALSPDIGKDLWAKMLYNDLLNPLGALVGVPYGALGEAPETRAIMRALAEETFSVMHAAGFQTHWATAEEYLETFYDKLLPPTAEHPSSMLQDLRAGRPTEVASLCGAITKLAEKTAVPAPLNQALLILIHAAESRNRATD